LRARTSGELRSGDEGFTLIEMTIAITILAVTLMFIAYGLFSGMTVLEAARHKTAFFELANAEAERMRSVPYAEAGVDQSDVDVLVGGQPHYPGRKFPLGGRNAVILSDGTAAFDPVTEYPNLVDPAIPGVPTPYTVKRWVTWTDTQGGAPAAPGAFKRLDVRIEWNEPNGSARAVEYTTLYYPGDLGPPEPIDRPVARFDAAVADPPLHPLNEGIAPWAGIVNEVFTVDASDSTGANSYQWDFGGVFESSSRATPPSSPLGPITTVSYDTPGTYTITLVVKNVAGVASAPVSKTVLVGNDKTDDPLLCPASCNVRPVASLIGTSPPDQTSNSDDSAPFRLTQFAPMTVVVDASATVDAEGDGLLYEWDWGDGTLPFGRGVGATHDYQVVGDFNLKLTVRDPQGGSDVAVIPVRVDGVRCDIRGAEFLNPATAVGPPPPPVNFIKLKGPKQSNNPNKNRPDDAGFRFTARTNSVCTAVSVSLPLATGAFTQSLTAGPLVGDQRTWTFTGNITPSFNAGLAQSGTFTANGPIAFASFPITFGTDY
jgi:prepilin-type N-terminal cleavage/methylation domain-containing protein